MLIEQPAGHVTTQIMPARPLCFGRAVRDLPACAVCRCFNMCLAAWRSVYIWTYHESKSALLRVYTRENHDLRERVEALEWYLECVDNISRAYHRWAGVNPFADDDRLHDAYIEAGATLAHARKEAGV